MTPQEPVWIDGRDRAGRWLVTVDHASNRVPEEVAGGDLGLSAYTLFQIMTLESWSMGIVRPVMEVHPYAWVFFVPFIMVTTFAVVNLLVGLIVNSMQEAHAEEANEATDTYRTEVIETLKRIETRIDHLERERRE